MEREEKAHGARWTSEHQIQDEEVLALLEKESKGKFAPGASWAYSNSGYVVLGLIVAKVSGSTYGDFLERRIFAPLGMNGTLVYQNGKNEIRNRAYGHTLKDGKFVVTDQSSTSATLGDGGIYSNLDDLSKWDEALANHKLLSAQEMQPALVPVELTDGRDPHWPVEADDDNLAPGQPVSYGFGWFLDSYQRPTTHVAQRQHHGLPHSDRAFHRRSPDHRDPLQSNGPRPRKTRSAARRSVFEERNAHRQRWAKKSSRSRR